jgi:hypothetical protein
MGILGHQLIPDPAAVQFAHGPILSVCRVARESMARWCHHDREWQQTKDRHAMASNMLQARGWAVNRKSTMTQILNIQPDSAATTVLAEPDITLDVRETFGIDIDMKVPAFSIADERVPDRDDPMCSIRTPRWRSLRALPTTAA